MYTCFSFKDSAVSYCKKRKLFIWELHSCILNTIILTNKETNKTIITFDKRLEYVTVIDHVILGIPKINS